MRIDGGRHGEKADEANAADILKRMLPEVASELRHCHQLDYATSGVMLYAVSRKAAAAAALLFQERSAQKEYLALVVGTVRDAVLECRAPVCQDPEHDFKMMCGDRDLVWPLAAKNRRKHSGPAATTLFLLSYGRYYGKPVTKVRVVPSTGRRHQIRLHCLTLGHPVVGDATYAPVDPVDARMMLHAHKLFLPFHSHPHLALTAPDPFTPERLPGLQLDVGIDHSTAPLPTLHVRTPRT
mmetsp:Transcript_2675/g.8390  ORF Transcript_2675/g.8390 Transcript_2675/m.8390 type:complete len:239 (-) Transcript_2675:224-940(-)